ncbi:MAG: chitobiase/beta-hexosaminidase C-terminal domain-containing protein, partial [bacterium]|nr:chitobiase/beta-hexosaminidase C-terminal domain-containing protein [bacterium]
YYTKDGSEPGQNSTLYTVPIHLTSTTTLKARAYKTGFSPSQTTEGTFVIQIKKSDISRDTSVDITDVILSLRMAIGLDIKVSGQRYIAPYNDWLIAVADANNDGIVGISDVILAIKIAIGLS